MNEIFNITDEKYISFQLEIEHHYPTLEDIFITFIDYFGNTLFRLKYITPIRPKGRINTYNNIFIPNETDKVMITSNIVESDFKYIFLHTREIFDQYEDNIHFKQFKNLKYYSNEKADITYEKIVFLYNGMEQEYGLNSNKPLLLKKMQEKHPETLFISLLDHQLPNGTYYSLYEGNNLFNEHVEFVNFLAKKHKTKRILLCGSSAGGSFALKLGAKLLLKVLVFSPQYNIEAYGNSVQNKALTILEYHKYYEIPSFIPKEYIQVLKEHNLLVYVYSDIDPDSNQNLTEEFNTNEPCFIKCMDEHKDVLENNLDILHNSLLLL